MTRSSLKPITQRKYNFDAEPQGNNENRGLWHLNTIRQYAAPKPETYDNGYSLQDIYKGITTKYDMERDQRLTILETQYIKS